MENLQNCIDGESRGVIRIYEKPVDRHQIHLDEATLQSRARTAEQLSMRNITVKVMNRPCRVKKVVGVVISTWTPDHVCGERRAWEL